jgi:hypothetical protein
VTMEQILQHLLEVIETSKDEKIVSRAAMRVLRVTLER